jgi:hypothetical protein
MIQLKSLFNEQGAVMRQGPSDPNAIKGAFNPKRIAQQIYDAKGTFSDNEEKVMPAIQSIKNTKQYIEVNKELQKLTDGRGMGEYLTSFLDINPRLMIASYLLQFIPANQWGWTIKKIVPWNDFRTVAQNDPSIYDKWRAGETGIGEEKALIKLMGGPYKQAWSKWSSLSAGEQLNAWWKDNGHTVLTVLQIGTAFLGPIGWLVSAGIGLVDANEYRKEGDTKTAGLIAIFSLMPGMGKLIAKIPGVKQLGKKGMAILAKKISIAKTTAVKFSKIEMEVLEELAKHDKFIKMQVEMFLKTGIARNAKQVVASKTKTYIKNGLLNFAKATAPIGGLVAVGGTYNYAYDVATMATPAEVQQQITIELDRMYDQEMKSRK